MESSIPIPVTGADYRWLNLMVRKPLKAIPRIMLRVAQGIGGLALRRRYAAGGQALAAGLFTGVLRAGIPVWTDTELVNLTGDGDRIDGATVVRDGTEIHVRASRGVIVATGDSTTRWRGGGSSSRSRWASI